MEELQYSAVQHVQAPLLLKSVNAWVKKFDSKNNLCVSDNLGSKNRSNAISACSALSPSGKWSVPTTSQLSKWSTLYSNFGITAGQTVWSQTTGTGSCASYGTTTYSCYCNGSYRSGYTSSSSCCSGCSYGSSSGLADVCTAVVSSSLYTPTRWQGNFTVWY